MIHTLYQSLLKWAPSRKCVRKVRAKMQNLCGYSDPYENLVQIASVCQADQFLDIGCHTGETLLRFFETGLKCSVSAFDPIPRNIQATKALLSANSLESRTTFYELALSNSDGFAEFFVSANDQMSSLLQHGHGNKRSFSEFSRVTECIQVETKRLDTWSSGSPINCAVIKCDAQGAEGSIVEGGEVFIREKVAAFYGEVMLDKMYEGQTDFEDLREILEVHCGLVLKNVFPCLHDASGRAVQMDALWVKPEYLSCV